jgi:uncharacterized protein YcbK (DUF882 family)
VTHDFTPARRSFLNRTARLVATAALPTLATSVMGAPRLQPVAAPIAAVSTSTVLVQGAVARALALAHTHTREKIELVYASGEQYWPRALGRLNHFLRDHYTGDIGLMDAQVFELLHRVQQALGSKGRFEVISGYRCPATNTRLRQSSGGDGVAQKSLHMQGRAIDVRLPGVPLAELHEAALSLRAGGVGFYPREQFIHLDTGRVRSW